MPDLRLPTALSLIGQGLSKIGRYKVSEFDFIILIFICYDDKVNG